MNNDKQSVQGNNASKLSKQSLIPNPDNIQHYRAEKVLCISRRAFPLDWVGKRAVTLIDESVFFANFLNQNCPLHWLDRSVAETDTQFKQIIPYILIQADNGNLTAIYKRKGSESRLHDLWSMGIGGHINPSDNF
ncbi:MAG: hypothetical protein HQK65_14610, partial [Desulfamplus sp.]|nr:hypothetical protein [Desulfamplus sp.]